MINSNVGRYVDFKALHREQLRRPDGSTERLPCSREDIFTSTSIGLIEKRVLMRFLTSCIGAANGTPTADLERTH